MGSPVDAGNPDAALAVGIIIFGVDPHVPMFVGVMAAAIMALHLGYKWDEVEKSMMDGIYKALRPSAS